MKKTGFYIITDKFFEDMQVCIADLYLKENKAEADLISRSANGTTAGRVHF